MDKLVIEGGHRLRGSLPISGSKNTALALMAAALLPDGPSTFTNIPDLKDIDTFSKVIRVTGAGVDFDAAGHTLRIDPTPLAHPEAPYELVKRMRASFYMLGALLGRCGRARVSLPGGCAWGPRPVDLHLEGMKALGAEVELDKGYVVARARGGRLEGGTFRLEPSSVGATVNLVLAAATARGHSRIENAAIEPDVVVFCEALHAMGARIEGIGTRTLEIEGVTTLRPVTFANCADRIELGTFMIAALLAGTPGDTITLEQAGAGHLGQAFLDAFRATGAELHAETDRVHVTVPDEVRAVSIETDVYPGFPTDLQAQWTVLMTQAKGNAKIVDRIYLDRFKHVPELRRMGANAIVVGNEVVVEGTSRLQGTTVMSTDLRGSVSLVLAGLVAEGETHVLRVYHLDRGYEKLEEKLSRAGIVIRRTTYDEFADPLLEHPHEA
ncbi:UDP-N-acetylglucosamine 1-carboxyvinyltransferase [Rhodocaloribacter litoris]|uniref:UDP-N-acetylglucosamine 1-carboxyvinyltransferase n=1 Tax=Rhodocaloribacter litoris TaxID=2558931 RepID=UPI00141E78AE|nr:UDP-N-acetylglucosamine 1-carboxyvinyltransferase [Rhodocaloribacter litoris]QXD15329.1 UDP-N-acetylglucosamine 1-carboxyvinyltransferase [Rhodocaloribacter litoris]GIV62342.1 MAG: UDP-N-acetylglucosamine 1-carboxyvinyltransferase [Rhodothermaceae bacterium]